MNWIWRAGKGKPSTLRSRREPATSQSTTFLMAKRGAEARSNSTAVSPRFSSCLSKPSTKLRPAATVRSPSPGIRVVTFPCTTNFNRQGRLSMPQCTPSSFSKSLMFALTFSGILLGSLAGQTPAPASPQGAASQTDAKPIPELQGQISNLLGEIKTRFSDLKKKEDQEKTGKSQEDLARTVLGEVLGPRHAIPQYA